MDEMMKETLECVEIETASNPTTSIIWLHGLGADGHDFPPIVEALALPPDPIRFVFPHAPMRPVTINGGYVMRAWYDIIGTEFEDRREDEAGLRASQGLVENLIAREQERGTPPSRTVLAGFSQGGAMALQTGLRHGSRLAGLMVLSAYLPIVETVTREATQENRDVPIFMAHGSFDATVPIEYARRSSTVLGEMGYPVEWHEYPMAHSVGPDEIDDIGAWLAKVISREK